MKRYREKHVESLFKIFNGINRINLIRLLKRINLESLHNTYFYLTN